MIDATMIGNYGFPIAITIYVLLERSIFYNKQADKYDETSKGLTEALTELSTIIRERVR